MPNKISFTINNVDIMGFKGRVISIDDNNNRSLDNYMKKTLGERNYNKILNCKRYIVTYEKRKNGVYNFDGSSICNKYGESFYNCLIPFSWTNCNVKRYITALE